jgi:hypothetical protein
MFTQLNRSVLLAGLLSAVLAAPAWSEDGMAKAEPAGGDLPMALATSPPVQPGPVVERESLATEAGARADVVEGEGQPTRSYMGHPVGKRYAGKRLRTARAAVAYARPVYRHSLMLGIGY